MEEKIKELKNTDRKTITLFVIGILLIGTMILSVGAYYELKTFKGGGQWYCIANECQNYIETADELINNICNSEGGKMVCKFNLRGEDYVVDLDKVDITSLINIKNAETFRDGCKEWRCSTQLFLKGDEQ